MKKYFSLSLLISLSFFCFSCGMKSDVTTVKLSFWGDNEEIAIMKSIVEPWDKAHKEIKVVLEHIPFAQYMQKIQTEFAAGVGPDIVACEVNNFIDMYSKDLLLPLDDLVRQDQEMDISDYYPEILRRFTRDGKLFIIARDIAPIAAVYYNKSLFNEAGIPYPKDDWTTEDLVRIGKQLTKKEGNITTQFGFFTWAWWNWLYTFGGGFVDDYENPQKLVLSSYKSRQGIQFAHDLIYKHGISPSPSVDQTGTQLFMTGRLAMYGSGGWESPLFRKITAFDWDVVMLPKGPDGKRNFASGGSGYGITRSSKNPEAAWKVLKMLVGRETQIKTAETGLLQPSMKSLVRSPYFNESEEKPLNKRMLDKAVQYINFDPFHPNWPQFNNTVVGMNMELYFRNQVSLDEALRKIDDEYSSRRPFLKR